MAPPVHLIDSVFVVTKHQRYEKIHRHDILYVQAEGSWVDIITLNRTYRLATNLGTIEAQLDAENFSRVSRKHIVNLCHIDSLQGNEVMIGSTAVAVGPQYREALWSRLPILRTKHTGNKLAINQRELL